MVYHVITIAIGTLMKIKEGSFDIRRTQIPMPKDLFDIIHDLKFFVGMKKTRPKMVCLI